MKREELKAKFVEAEVQEEKIASLIDYIMAQNGNDLNSLKSENEALKTNYAKEIESKNTAIKELEEKQKGFSDYEELKKFKVESEANAEKSKRIEFLKNQGCKHPDLVLSQIDFEKASYDDTKKTYIGLDETIKNLKTSYSDLFESKAIPQITKEVTPNSSDSDFMARFKKDHPNLNL